MSLLTAHVLSAPQNSPLERKPGLQWAVGVDIYNKKSKEPKVPRERLKLGY